jgi:NAD(P) transhydrogenase subunit alpha
VLGTASNGVEITLGFVAVVLATVNVVGGFVVTDRMLEMFKGRQPGRGPNPDGPVDGPQP